MYQQDIQLDSRLTLIATMVRPGAVLADIGTDHGRLVAHLAQTGKIVHGYACDVNPKPLQKAALLLQALHLTNKVQTVLCSGLDLLGTEVTDIVMAGMGGELIYTLLEAWPFAKDPTKHYLLQPMTKAVHLRTMLYQAGYSILEERCATDGKFAYTVLHVQYTGQCITPSIQQQYLGAIINSLDAPAQTYIAKLCATLRHKATGIEHSGHSAANIYKILREIEECSQ